MNVSIRKSKHFNDARIIKGDVFLLLKDNSLFGDTTRHVFLKDAKEHNTEIMSVPYVFFSRYYKKWYEENAYMPKNIYNLILEKIK